MLWSYITKNDQKESIKPISDSTADTKLHFFRYLDEFLTLRCATDLIEHKIYPNSKEITESFAVLHSLRKYLNASSKDLVAHNNFNFNNPNVSAIVIGDGATPRVGSLLCFITKWRNVYSVDPILKINKNKAWKNINHLKCLRSKIEDITIKINANDNVVVIFMHSHVLLEQSLLSICFDHEHDANKHKIAVITAPCCQFIEKHKTLYDKKPDYSFTDISMASEKNIFYIWKDVKIPSK